MDFIYITGAVLTGLTWLALVNYNRSFWAFASLVGFGWLLHLSGVTTIAPMFESWFSFGVSAGIYLATGFFWSIIKWFLYVRKQYKEYRIARDRYNEWVKNHPHSVEAKVPWEESSNYKDWKRRLPPIAMRNKMRLTGWIVHWPMSVIVTLLDDWLSKALDAIVETFRYGYDKLTKLATPSDVEDELKL